jgi:GNAT superfamily N-acetyltransferase
MIYETWRDDVLLSTDPARLDLDAIFAFLKTTYWSVNKSQAQVETSLAHSLCFGLYHNDAQIGLTRVVTDYATVAYLADVYVLPAYRGRGLGKWMIAEVVNFELFQDLKNWLLYTRDAHGLYAAQGFVTPPDPTRIMVRGRVRPAQP